MAHYRVKPHDPRRHTVRLALYGLVAAGLLAIAFTVGYLFAGYRYEALSEAVGQLRTQLDATQSQRRELQQRASLAERTSESNRAEAQEARQALAELQSQLIELREELVFYQSLLSPAERDPGLHIKSFEVLPTEQPNHYQYLLILTQVRSNSRFASGHVSVGVASASDETEPSIERELDRQDFRYKFFQRVSGEFEWKEGALPAELIVTVSPSSGRLESVAEVYPWQSVVSGEQ
ncbi:conserved hypothetical protein [gamma proteobacterium HTCC5015]|nr:conserved hypothetical protein [gamma proteobacterium HTCC5015]